MHKAYEFQKLKNVTINMKFWLRNLHIVCSGTCGFYFFFIYFRKEYYYFPFTDNNSCNLSFWKSNANINKMHLPKRCLNFLDLSENLRNLAVCLKISAHSRDQALGIMSLLSSWQGMMFSWERNSSPTLQTLWHYRVFPHSALGDNMNF